VGNHLGALDQPFVIEGDEYDSAFFDKRSKFIHYAPHVAVLNNLEFDHADIFRDLADVQRTFSHLTRIVPRHGWIVLNGDDENLRSFAAVPWTRVIRVGTGESNDIRVAGFKEDASGVRFSLECKNRVWANIAWSLPGLYNARNAAMAATAAALSLLPEPSSSSANRPAQPSDHALDVVPQLLQLDALARFRGVKRRQEVLVSKPGLTVIEDFGHHPTALAETLISFRSRFPGAVLTAVFEPRSNTARTKSLQDGFMRALAHADEVYLGAVNRAEKLAAEERFDADGVAVQLRAKTIKAQASATNAALLDTLSGATLPISGQSRVIVFFSNGSFDGIIAQYAKRAQSN
jgi:UDP-N-acetylmuramate: L-alanyl-gamma-D-glutamyl-meso-diaminopimelate ligase